MEQWHSSKMLYAGRVVRLRVGEARLEDGRLALREVVEHPGGVCILPFDGERVTLVRQFRIAVGEHVLEAPAGKLEPGDSPEVRGRLELEEEAGLRAGRVVPAGVVFASVGFCSERIWLYLAFDLTPVPPRPEEEERIERVTLTLEEVRAGLQAHRFNDAKTVCLLHALLAHLREHAREP
jgi:ADP-ribose pyrophosphatase